MADTRFLLLIEDDETTRAVLTVLLENDGWTVTGAASGEDALDALQSGGIAQYVVLCDQNLPGLQGPELAAALRALGSPRCLIAMTASLCGEPPAGHDALLVKPFSPQELHDLLQRSEQVRSAPTAPPGADVLSTQVFEQLQRQMGAGARDLYQFALADAEQRLDRMNTAADTGDTPAFCREAHALKGSAGMIGAQELAALASRAEVAHTTVEDVQRHEVVHAMRLACAAIRRRLEALFQD